ncbi:MAG: DUF4162 domain-containing protein, partial [Planctomycetales bacterium]|nr:DUF4162 domain-containing protein [Planctomycetales bacterium]
AGLDPRARIELRVMIRELAANGKSILVSSHILTELAEMCDRVGIIERGELLATGSVDDIQREQRTHREVKMRVLENAPAAAEWLRRREGITHVLEDGALLKFSHIGEREDEAALLRELILADFAVAEFASHSRSLEDVFMQVTKGRVQ